MLTLFEELFLLSLDEDSGNILSFAKKTFAYGIAGAILSELAIQDKVTLNEKHRLVLQNTDPTGNEILDEAIHEIKQVEKHHRPSYWISQFNLKKKKLREQLGISLTEKGILHQEDKHFFWIYNEDEVDHSMAPFKFQLKSSLRGKILATEANDARSLALLKILASSGMLGLVFTQDEQTLSTRTINEKMIRAALENPVLQPIEEICQGVAICLEEELD